MSEKLVSFPPILPKEPKVLILGSMPSVKSLEKQQYYGNPRNHFWPILFRLFQQDPIEGYGERIEFVKKHGIALWDSIGLCYREGSLDSAIREEEPNNIFELTKQYPSIRFIGCNGTKSYDTFRKYFGEYGWETVHIERLPSTSPIPGKYTKSFEEKVQAWSILLNYLD